jgi:LacI family transcriptional regulator
VATIRDVARRAGVSTGTVSNVLNRPSYVNSDVRLRVEAAIAELDFVPRKARRQYRPGLQRILGLALADMNNPFFVDIAIGAEAEAKESGVALIICNNGEDPEREEQNFGLLERQRVQGIMVASVDEQNPRLEELSQRGIPMVYVDRIHGDRPCCSLAIDNTLGGRLAGEHLLSMGHTHVAFLGDLEIGRQVQERHSGFTGVIAESCGRVGAEAIRFERLAAARWTFDEGRRAGRRLLERPADDRPTAIFCANDMLALGMLQELVLRGVSVPGEIALVGFDDLDWAAAAAVPLSSVHQPRKEMGRMAVRLILDEIEGGPTHEHQHIIYPPTLRVRNSSDWSASPRPER